MKEAGHLNLEAGGLNHHVGPLGLSPSFKGTLPPKEEVGKEEFGFDKLEFKL